MRAIGWMSMIASVILAIWTAILAADGKVWMGPLEKTMLFAGLLLMGALGHTLLAFSEGRSWRLAALATLNAALWGGLAASFYLPLFAR